MQFKQQESENTQFFGKKKKEKALYANDIWDRKSTVLSK